MRWMLWIYIVCMNNRQYLKTMQQLLLILMDNQTFTEAIRFFLYFIYWHFIHIFVPMQCKLCKQDYLLFQEFVLHEKNGNNLY